jgi:hypothetical protein
MILGIQEEHRSWIVRQPTAAECSANSLIFDGECVKGYAIWYPSMGGYVGKALAISGGDGGCVDVYVWHDGEFPFDSEDDSAEPVYLHHCTITDFIRFGEQLIKLFGEEREEP